MEKRAVYTIVGEESKQRDWAALAVQQSEAFTVTTQQNYDTRTSYQTFVQLTFCLFVSCFLLLSVLFSYVLTSRNQ